MSLTRRHLIRGSLAAGLLTTTGPLPGVHGLAFAADGRADPHARTDTLVVVFLRGGADALSLVAPANDPDYLAARVPELRVATDGPKAGIPLDQSVAPAIDFRLHGEMAPLAELYHSHQMAIIHAAGITDETRSHFVAQDLIERGVAAERDLDHETEGWIARWLGNDQPAAVPAIGTATAPVAALAGLTNALAVTDLRYGLAPPGGPAAAEILPALHAGNSAYEVAARAALSGFRTIDQRLPRGADGKVLAYAGDGGAVYEENESGRAFQTVARLIKMDLGLRTACVDIGGWDTHENQPGRLAGTIGQFSRALAAFYTDTARYHASLTIVVLSEFGRRLRSNRSLGTDHGHGGVMLVLGGRVGGGRMLGRWPGLAAHELDRGVDLAVTTDYRSVLGSLIGKDATARAFPGFQPGQPLDLLISA